MTKTDHLSKDIIEKRYHLLAYTDYYGAPGYFEGLLWNIMPKNWASDILHILSMDDVRRLLRESIHAGEFDEVDTSFAKIEMQNLDKSPDLK